MKRTILLTPNIMSSLSISHQGQSLGVEAHSPRSFFIKLYNHPLFLEENEVLTESDRSENDLLLQEIKQSLKDVNTFKAPLSFKGIRSLVLRSIEELELSGLTSSNLNCLKFPDPKRTDDIKEIINLYFSKRPSSFTYPNLLCSLQERVLSGKLDSVLKEIEIASPLQANFSLSGIEDYLLKILKGKCAHTDQYFSHLPLVEKKDYSNVEVSGVIKDKTAFLNLFFWMKNKNISADQITIGAFEYDRFAPVLYQLSTEFNTPVNLKRGLSVTNFSFFEKLMSKFKGELSEFKTAFTPNGKEEPLEALFKKKALGIKKELTNYFEKTTSLGNPLLLENELIASLSKVRFTPEELGMDSSGLTLYPVEELDYLSFENLAILGLEDHNYPPKEKRHPLLDEETKIFLNKHSDLKLPLNSQSIKVDLVERLIQGTKNEVFLTFEAYSLETGKKIIPSPFFNKILKTKSQELTVENTFLLGKVPSGLLEELNVKNPFQDLSHTQIVTKKNSDYISKVFSPELNELDFIEAKETLEKISASSLEAWFSCPYKFALKELKKLKVPDVSEVDKSFWLSPPERGTFLHATYEKILTPFIDEKSKSVSRYKKFLKSLGDTPHTILNEILAAQKDYRSEVPEWVKKEQIVEMHSNIDLFINNEIAWVDENNYYPICLEKKFIDYNIPFFESGPILTGSIDRVDTDGEGSYVIWDYKTGSMSLMKGDKTLLLKEKGKSKKTISFHLQHGFYSDVLVHIIGKKEKFKEIKAGYYYVDEDERILSSSSDYTEHFKSLKEFFIEELNKGVFYKNSKSCSYCDYSPFCLGLPELREDIFESAANQIEKIEEFKSGLIELKKMRVKDE